jgi:hypothetical protein
LESGIWNLEFGIWNLEFGIWNLELILTNSQSIFYKNNEGLHSYLHLVLQVLHSWVADNVVKG